MIIINVAQDFSRHPAGRFLADGPFSGEAFRRKFLEPAFKKGEQIRIVLDGARGYGSSFLEEAFGGLVRKGYKASDIKENLIIEATNTSLRTEILDYIEKAKPL